VPQPADFLFISLANPVLPPAFAREHSARIMLNV
jgi:hypothetical protein